MKGFTEAPKMIGLMGAHRVGKSTLMQNLSTTPVLVDISRMQRSHGYDSSNQNYSARDRCTIQSICLKEFRWLLTTAITQDSTVVTTDRTPLDLVAYSILNLEDAPKEVNQWLINYTTDCIELLNQYYSHVFLVQPGIPLITENTTSAPCDEAMIEKLNEIFLGILLDPRIKPKVTIIDREVTDLDQRVKLIEEIIKDEQ